MAIGDPVLVLTEEGTTGQGTITTYTGRRINPLKPDVNEVDFEDIAHALSNVCRFTGHTTEFYSVAQHSVYVSELVRDWGYSLYTQMKALMHDASEAYVSDIARPVKQSDVFKSVYAEIEKNLTEVIDQKFGLDDPYADVSAVHYADTVMLQAELRDLMPLAYDTTDADMHWKMTVIPAPPARAKAMFVARFDELVLVY